MLLNITRPVIGAGEPASVSFTLVLPSHAVLLISFAPGVSYRLIAQSCSCTSALFSFRRLRVPPSPVVPGWTIAPRTSWVRLGVLEIQLWGLSPGAAA